jgi:hypothetical protein
MKVRLGLSLMLVLASALTFAAPKKDNAYRNFWHPMIRGERVDYCNLPGTECGMPIAHRYCQMMGYDFASQEIKAPNIGFTRHLDCRTQCKGWRCNGFMLIGCAKKFSPVAKVYNYRKRYFAYPRYNNYRIDWCYSKQKDCGRRAANSFCLRMGYSKAIQFAKEHYVQATATIGKEELCFGEQCEGFKSIVCYR